MRVVTFVRPTEWRPVPPEEFAKHEKMGRIAMINMVLTFALGILYIHSDSGSIFNSLAWPMLALVWWIGKLAYDFNKLF